MVLYKIRILTGILLALMVSGCSTDVSNTYVYHPSDNLDFTFQTKTITRHKDTKSIFLYFELVVSNHSETLRRINVGEIHATLNGILSKRVYYDSLASVLPRFETLKKGKTSYKLYFVFPEKIAYKNSFTFNVIGFGLKPG